MNNQQYPEHDKLRLVKKESQACGEFIDWLETRGYYVKEKKRGMPMFNIHRCLAAFFEIDEVKLEDEKLAMLDELRNSQNAILTAPSDTQGGAG